MKMFKCEPRALSAGDRDRAVQRPQHEREACGNVIYKLNVHQEMTACPSWIAQPRHVIIPLIFVVSQRWKSSSASRVMAEYSVVQIPEK